MASTTPENGEVASSKKATYRITNWPAYDRALVARGDITFWFDQEAIIRSWTPEPTGQRGAPWRDADGAIQTLLVLSKCSTCPIAPSRGLVVP